MIQRRLGWNFGIRVWKVLNIRQNIIFNLLHIKKSIYKYQKLVTS